MILNISILKFSRKAEIILADKFEGNNISSMLTQAQ